MKKMMPDKVRRNTEIGEDPGLIFGRFRWVEEMWRSPSVAATGENAEAVLGIAAEDSGAAIDVKQGTSIGISAGISVEDGRVVVEVVAVS